MPLDSDDGDSVGFDTLKELVQDHHRCIVLSELIEEQRTLTVRDLTHHIVQHDHDALLPEVPEEVGKEIQISLDQNHLPRLEATGLIEYDRKRGLVEPTEKLDDIQSDLVTLLDADADLD